MAEKDFRDVKVEEVYEIMIGKPALVYEDAILKDAVEAVTQNLISRKVYVIDEEGTLKGMISIETLLRHAGYRVGVREQGIISLFKYLTDIIEDKVTDVMNKNPVTITNDDKVVDAVQKMVEHHLNDLPVIDEEGRIIGELNGLEILKYAKQLFEK